MFTSTSVPLPNVTLREFSDYYPIEVQHCQSNMAYFTMSWKS